MDINLQLEHLRSRLVINKHQLDDEIVQQPMLFHTAGELAAACTAAMDAARDELKTVDANVSLQLREESKHLKLTESQLITMVQTSGQHQRASNAYIDACRTANEVQGLKDAFAQRGYMLRELANLFVAGYYSAASVTVAGAGSAELSAREGRAAMNEVRQKRTSDRERLG